jgi:hypothetical protein
MIMDVKTVRIWKKTAVEYFKILARHSPGEKEVNKE